MIYALWYFTIGLAVVFGVWTGIDKYERRSTPVWAYALGVVIWPVYVAHAYFIIRRE